MTKEEMRPKKQKKGKSQKRLVATDTYIKTNNPRKKIKMKRNILVALQVKKTTTLQAIHQNVDHAFPSSLAHFFNYPWRLLLLESLNSHYIYTC